MLTAYPKLRSDLVVSRQEAAGGPAFVLKDPRIGRFVRFKEPEYFIAQQFDGETALEEIRRRSEERFGAVLEAAMLERFAGKLATLGLLEDRRREQTGQPELPRPRVRGNLFSLRLRVVDP